MNNGAGEVDVNAVNNKGLTAMDVLNRSRSRSDVRDSEIGESLKRAGGAGVGASILVDKRIDDNNSLTKHLRETTNALMVVASVIAAMASQIAVNPPGGVWQDDNYLFDSAGNTVDPLGNRISYPVDSQNRSVLNPHRAGYSILATNNPSSFQSLCNFNTAAFYCSVVIIILVVTGFPSTIEVFAYILMVASFVALIMAMVTYSIAAVAWIPFTEEYGKNIVDADADTDKYYIVGPFTYFKYVFLLVVLCMLWSLICSLRRRGWRWTAASSAVPENNNSVV